MQFTNPLASRPESVRTHESSQLRSQRDSDSILKGWRKVGDIGWRVEQLARAVMLIQSNLARMKRRINGGDATIKDKWQKPYKELDTDRSVTKGTWVYISPNNPIVLTGMTDPIAGAGTKAYPGIWEAAQDVPASTGVDDYNVPQTDYPGATGTPTGTTPNYKGDLDGSAVYWILICPTCGL